MDSKKFLRILLNLLFLTVFLLSSNTTFAQKKCFKLPDQLLEASGLYVASPDSLYWLNDSGNAAEIYLTDGKGELLNTIAIPIQNKDWEDLTYDDKGNLYIGDFGNNRNQRKDLKIYIYHFPTARIDSITYSYPDQQSFPPPLAAQNFDMEGFFWHQDSLHLFSKNRMKVGNDYTKHYRLAAQAGAQQLDLQDSIYLKKRVVTAAAIHPDGQEMVLLTYKINAFLNIFPNVKVSLYTFRDYQGSQFFEVPPKRKKVWFWSPVTQYEAIDFTDEAEVLIASEQAFFYHQRAKRVKLKKRKKRARS
ncbi:MAG: hypothetical protein AAF849_15990 [Bacteroidota bacterium]